MRKNILVLALSIVSFGAFAQGLGDLKNAAKDAKNVDTEAIKEVANDAVKTVVEDEKVEANTSKVNELKTKAADAINVESETIDATKAIVAGVAGEAAENIASEKVVKIKESAEAKLADMKAKREAKLAEKKSDPEKLAEYNTELKSEVEEKEALKGEKKTALLAKITSLGSKITAAESKLGLLEKSGIDPAELLQKTAILDGAKSKLAALTSSFN
jgi:hypothetical protein